MLEIYEKYQNVILNYKISKKFKSLEETILQRLSDISNKIDANIDKVISIYKESISDLVLQLNVVNNDKNTYDKINNQLIALLEEILGNDVNEESLKLQQEEIAKINKIITYNQTRHKEAEKLEDICGRKATDFYEVLCEKNIADFTDFNKKMTNYDEPAYMYELFIRILIREDLIYNDGFFDDGGKVNSVSDQEMPYQKYRLLLTDKQRKMADDIYNGFTKSCEYKIKTFDELCSTLESYKIDVSKITTIKKALGALHKVRLEYEKKYNSGNNLLRNRTIAADKLSKMDISAIELKIQKLENEIAKYSYKIDDLKNKRVKK